MLLRKVFSRILVFVHCRSDPYVRITLVGGEYAGPSVRKTTVVKKVN